MVELKLERIEDALANAPSDCYVSVRIGETQKLSKLSTARAYRFPNIGDQRFGKIEVFHRIGQCNIDVDPLNAGTRDIKINIAGSGTSPPGILGLRVGLDADDGLKKKSEAGPEKKATKVKAAKEYLSKHGLESKLSEAMSAVLRERPSDPAAFLASKLQDSGPVRLPPLVRPGAATAANESGEPMPQGKASAKQEENLPASAKQARPRTLEPLPGKTAPAEEAAAPVKQAPPVNMLPFREYYKTHVQAKGLNEALTRLYAQFQPVPGAKEEPKITALPAKAPADAVPMLPFQPYYAANFSVKAVVPLDLYSKFPPAKRQQALPATGSFALSPSVGTWLTARATPATQVPATVVGYCLSGLRPPKGASANELQEVERLVTKALLEVSGECAGSYLPLANSCSYPPRPQGMTAEEAQELRKAGILLEGGGGPQCRGVFAPVAFEGIAVWINPSAECHLQFVAASKDGGAKLQQLEAAVKVALGKDAALVATSPLAASAGASSSAVAAGTPSSQAAAAAVPMLPFKAYYVANFAVKCVVPAGLYDKFPPATRQAPAADPKKKPAALGASFGLSPSVGTWLTPRGTQAASPNLAAAAGGATAAPAGAAGKPATFAVRPSVGTWLVNLRREVPATVVGYCLSGLRPPKGASANELQEVERLVTKALLELSGECAGSYLPLANSWSYPPRPQGMTAEEARELRKAGILLEGGGDPQCRGVFAPVAFEGIAVWINPSAECHLQFVAASKDGGAKLQQLEAAVKVALGKVGCSLAK